MTVTLTARYIDAAMRSISPASRDDVQAELEVSIADAIEARTERGATLEDAEKAVLTDLGDPGVLAAHYADRPLHLIGPRYYLTWWRLLKLLWSIVPAVAIGGVALGKALEDAPVGEIIRGSITAGLTAAVYVAFWVTVVFVVLERTTASSTSLTAWDVDKLPQIRPNGAGLADMVASLVFLALVVGALLWDQLRGFVRSDGAWLPILSPSLWPWWIIGLVVLTAARSAVVIAVYVTGRWAPIFAAIRTAIALTFAVPAIALLAAGQLANPEFVTAVFTNNGVNADTLHTLAIITGAGLIGFPAWTIIDVWMKTVRANRR